MNFRATDEPEQLLQLFDPYHRSREDTLPDSTDPDLLLALSISEETRDRYKLEIQRLQRVQLFMEKYARACRIITTSTPIRRLPNEILGVIFSLYCHERGNNISIWLDDDGKEFARVDAFTLASVCSHWNHLVRSLPCLVSAIGLDIENLSRMMPEASWGDIISKMFELSAPSEVLSVEILERWGRERNEKDMAILSQVFNCMEPSLARITHLEMIGAPLLLLQPPGSFLSLSSLVLDSLADVEGFSSLDLAQSAPNIRALRIYDEPIQLNLQWNNIRELEFLDSMPQFALRIITRCNLLESLYLRNCIGLDSEPEIDPPPPGPIDLRHLQSFKLYSCDSDYISYILPFLKMPALIHCDFHYFGADSHPALIALIQESRRSITSLFITCDFSSQLEQIKATLSECPNLETVILKGMPSEESDAPRSVVEASIEILRLFRWPTLPRLRKLGFSFEESEMHESSLISMIQSRRETEVDVKLEELLLEDSKKCSSGRKQWLLSEEAHTALRTMQKEGLRFDLEAVLSVQSL